ncbi:MAG: hypothetical protein ACE5K2_03125, partial [Candidatus Zixiibacteriota bacterium]
RSPGLGRDYIWSLVENDFFDLKKIRKAELADLQKFMPVRVAERLSAGSIGKERIQNSRFKIQDSRFAGEKHSTSHPPGGTGVKPLPQHLTEGTILVIDGSAVKDKFLVLVNGKRVILPAKSFKYLVKLTWALFKNDDGWIHKNDFEPGENQTRYLHRLKSQIKPTLNSGQALFENNRLGSYRLTIPKQHIKLNKDALLKNPDEEIKKMVAELINGLNG